MTDVRARRDLPWYVVIAVLAFTLRFLAVEQYGEAHPNATRVVIDEASYDRWARVIAGGEWLGTEVFFQEPLYPYALGTLYALVGESLHAARVAHCVLWALAAVLVGLLARRAFGRAAGFVASAAVALHGPGLLFPSLILKENLFLPIFAATALVLVRSRPLAGARAAGAWLVLGILGALGALLRGNVLVLLPVLAAWPLVRARLAGERVVAALPRAATFVAGALLVLLPVAWRNHHVGGVFALTTSGAGTNVYGGNNVENPYGRATEFSFVRGVPEHEAGDWRREAERRTGRTLDPGEVSAYWLSETWRSVRDDPLFHARILWNKLRLSLGSYEVPDNHMLDWDARYVPLARLPWPDFGVTGMLGLAGVLAWGTLVLARRRPAVPCAGGASELAILFVLYLGTIVLTVTSDRARLPLLVPLAAFAGFFAVRAVAWIRSRARVELCVATGALVVAALLAHVPALPESDRAEDWDEREYNLAVQWFGVAEREEEGRRIAEALLAKHPRTARIVLLDASYDAGHALRKARTAAADPRSALADALRRSSAIADDAGVFARERFRANALAAWIALEAGDFEESVRRYSLARAYDADSLELREGEARAKLELAAANARKAATLLDGPPESCEDATRLFESALDLLQSVALDERLSRLQRSNARTQAGWIQLRLGRLPNAERHLRAALELGDSGAAQGLIRVLVERARLANPGPDRDRLVDEARRRIGDLNELDRKLGGFDELLRELDPR